MARKLSLEEVSDVVESEGLCGALEYLNHNQIANSQLREVWQRARKSIQTIEAILEEGDVDFDDDDE